jgi:hypothetical protein
MTPLEEGRCCGQARLGICVEVGQLGRRRERGQDHSQHVQTGNTGSKRRAGNATMHPVTRGQGLTIGNLVYIAEFLTLGS